MKILLAVQGTGNGHISRAREILPYLERYGTVDVAISGTQADVELNQVPKFRFHGFSFIFGKYGGVDRWQTYKTMDFRQLIKDINAFPIDSYDLIINDFEPVVAWACKVKKKQCIALSHQSSFLSKKTPRPKDRWNWAELILSQYAPASEAIGFHFEAYDSFINTPVIRAEIRNLEPANKGHYTVYLPAFDDRVLIPSLSQVPDVQWEVFSKHSKTEFRDKNVWVRPINNTMYSTSVASCEGLLTGGGFEGPAEALY